jgi:hypothetical protein
MPSSGLITWVMGIVLEVNPLAHCLFKGYETVPKFIFLQDISCEFFHSD